MTTNYSYNTASNPNKGGYYVDSYSRPEQYKTEEQGSEHSGSPEKLYQFIDKENAVQDLKGTATFQSKTIKESGLSPEKIRGSQPREYNIPLKEKTNIMANNNIPMVESQALSKSEVMGVEGNINYAPQASFQRISTMNRTSQTFQLNRNDIVISVTDPSRKGDMIKHTYYCIQGNDKEGEFKVTRSHEDFTKIRNVLVKRWPGCYVPSVPPKRVLTKMVPSFLEGRRKEFEMFVQKITELPHLHYSREYQRFLRAANLDEELATFQKVAYDDIILRYKTTFKQALQLTATPEAEKKISEFKAFLQTIHSNFKRFKLVLKKTSATRQAYYEQLGEFHNIMSEGYEKDVLTRLETNYESKPVFYNTETGDMTERVSGIKQAGQMHSIEYLHAWIKAEAREIKAFLEAIHQKELYDEKRKKAFSKLSSTTNQLERTTAGKPGFVAMISGKSRETQISTLQGKVLGEDKEAKQLQTLYDTIVLVLAHSEIDRFKVRKSEQYHNVVNLAAQYELSNLQNLVDYWSTIITINPSRPSSTSRIDTQ